MSLATVRTTRPAPRTDWRTATAPVTSPRPRHQPLRPLPVTTPCNTTCCATTPRPPRPLPAPAAAATTATRGRSCDWIVLSLVTAYRLPPSTTTIPLDRRRVKSDIPTSKPRFFPLVPCPELHLPVLPTLASSYVVL